MKELYNNISNLCLSITVITALILLLSLLVYPIKLMYHKYKVNKINKEFPGNQPVITSRYPSTYLDFEDPVFIDFFQWFCKTNFKAKTLVVACTIIGILNIYTDYFGNDTIYSVFSKNEFKATYYVQLFPEGSQSKNYLVLADLHVYDDNIAISKVYWPSGGYTTFNKFGDMNSQDLYLYKHTRVSDDEGREWLINLTDIKSTKK